MAALNPTPLKQVNDGQYQRNKDNIPGNTALRAIAPPMAPARFPGLFKAFAASVLILLCGCGKKEGSDAVIAEERDVVVEQTPVLSPAPGSFAQSFRRYLANDARDPERVFFLNMAFPTSGAIPIGKSIPDVQALIDILREHPDLSIAIEGYADSSGNAAQNQQLSEQRAQAVHDLLIAAGIDANRVSAMGMGTITPLTERSETTAGVENHRIAIRVLN